MPNLKYINYYDVDYELEGVTDDTLTQEEIAAPANVVGAKLTTEMLYNEEIPDTIQTITFAADGSLQKITHKRSSTTIREDVFTFAGNMITEVRTLLTGETLTIATNTDTLAVTVTYTAAA